MKVFKSLEDVDGAGLPPPLAEACRETLAALIGAYAEHGDTYDPEDDGYVVLVEEGDEDGDLEAECGYGLGDAPFEGGIFEAGVFRTCVLHNNQFGISIVVPDAPWLPPEIRARLLDACDMGARP